MRVPQKNILSHRCYSFVRKLSTASAVDGSVRSFSAHIIGTSFMTSIKFWDFLSRPLLHSRDISVPLCADGPPPYSLSRVAVICGWSHSSGLSFSSSLCSKPKLLRLCLLNENGGISSHSVHLAPLIFSAVFLLSWGLTLSFSAA